MHAHRNLAQNKIEDNREKRKRSRIRRRGNKISEEI
jgi:hypothetical protein